MDYLSLFKEKNIISNPNFPHNDIGIAQLFYELHSAVICYVVEAKTWYIYTGKRWSKDDGGLLVMEKCKDFAQALIQYANAVDDGKDFIKYASSFHSRRKRDGLLSDARSVAPKKLIHFDRDKTLFNCQNGTFSLNSMALRPHTAEDYITKISRVTYDPDASCERWERFIGEVMDGDADTARFLQKALGYCLSGETALECFFILYGSTTRNGKTTLTETVAYILGDYARTSQPQTLSRRPHDGAAASPDIARLKGARLVNMPEPEKGLELNIALVKQLTGGDTYTGRFLHENPVEFAPEFKIFINTNHLPRASDDTVFASGRVKLIPFDRHFKPEEQDTGLKEFFRRHENMSSIFNWLIQGYQLLQADGLAVPPRVAQAIANYRVETDIIGDFVNEILTESEGSSLKTSDLYKRYQSWVKSSGYKAVTIQEFVGGLRRRHEILRDREKGNVIVGFKIKM